MKKLNKYGYRAVAPALPSVDKAPGYVTPDSQEDIAAVRSALISELDTTGNDVIVVPHSYGGVPASGAIKGLDPKSRTEEGKKTSVIAMAALTSYVMPEGMTLPEMEQRDRPDVPDLWGGPPTPASLFWHDLPADSELHKSATEQLNVMSTLALYDKNRFAAFKVVPVHYLVCGDDRAIPMATQERIVETMRAHGGKVRTELLEGSAHSPFLTRVEETAAFLRRSAGEAV